MDDEQFEEFKKVYNGPVAGIYAATFTPLGLAIGYLELPKYFDSVSGNENFIFSLLSIYMVGRGIERGIAFTKNLNKGGLEDKIDKE